MYKHIFVVLFVIHNYGMVHDDGLELSILVNGVLISVFLFFFCPLSPTVQGLEKHMQKHAEEDSKMEP